MTEVGLLSKLAAARIEKLEATVYTLIEVMDRIIDQADNHPTGGIRWDEARAASSKAKEVLQ